jgi:hypothetical protein
MFPLYDDGFVYCVTGTAEDEASVIRIKILS